MKIHEQEIAKINEDFKKNKDKTVNYLVESLLSVDLTVPDVVIGRFAAKVLGK